MIGKHTAVRAGVVAVALGVVLAGCTGGVQPVGPGSSSATGSSSPVAVWPSPEATGTPELTDEQLYRLAVKQYQKLFAALSEVEQNGGVPELPAVFSTYLMDPAWSAINEFFTIMYERGDKYTDELDSHIISIAEWHSEKTPHDSVTAIQTCELSQGAALVDATGEVIADESPTLMHRWAYFKFDPSDGTLKVFILNGEAVDECPISYGSPRTKADVRCWREGIRGLDAVVESS